MKQIQLFENPLDQITDECIFADPGKAERKHTCYQGQSMALNKQQLLHYKGPPPEPGMYALHTCHNETCINPRHQRWGTPKENIHESPQLKLTELQVIEIRMSNETTIAIATRFNISQQCVSQIQTGEERKLSPGPIRPKRKQGQRSLSDSIEIAKPATAQAVMKVTEHYCNLL